MSFIQQTPHKYKPFPNGRLSPRQELMDNFMRNRESDRPQAPVLKLSYRQRGPITESPHGQVSPNDSVSQAKTMIPIPRSPNRNSLHRQRKLRRGRDHSGRLHQHRFLPGALDNTEPTPEVLPQAQPRPEGYKHQSQDQGRPGEKPLSRWEQLRRGAVSPERARSSRTQSTATSIRDRVVAARTSDRCYQRSRPSTRYPTLANTRHKHDGSADQQRINILTRQMEDLKKTHEILCKDYDDLCDDNQHLRSQTSEAVAGLELAQAKVWKLEHRLDDAWEMVKGLRQSVQRLGDVLQ